MRLVIDSEKRRVIALLAAASLFLATIDFLIPKPLPFIRLGIANIPLLLAASFVSLNHFLILILLKVLGQGLVNGTLFSYISFFSAGGSFSSGLLMFGLCRLPCFSMIGISCAAAFFGNAARLIISYFFLFADLTFYMAPPLLLFGSVSGFFLGVFCQQLAKRGKWLTYLRAEYQRYGSD